MNKRQRMSAADPRGAGAAPSFVDALSVGELTRCIREVLEETFYHVRVYGEIVGLSTPRSGHVYLNLKDPAGGVDARISVVIWRDRARSLRFPLEDGQQVIVEGRIGLYEPRGTYQIIATAVKPAGRGALLVALERLKESLWAEGLFDASRKRPLPLLPRAIGVVTSPSGAALRDVLRAIRRKFPSHVRVFPALVQGDRAGEEIAAALQWIGANPGVVDVVILARGGGSLEDLWAFNEERVVRAVAACPVPVISGIGHEVDSTLADLAADACAQTPTQAGDLAVPDRLQLLVSLDELRARLARAGLRRLDMASERLRELGERLQRGRPEALLERREEDLLRVVTSLKKSLYNRFRVWEDQLLIGGEKLDALNPYNVLERGFSVTRTLEGTVVRNVDELQDGEPLVVQLANGEIDVKVLAARRRSPGSRRSPGN